MYFVLQLSSVLRVEQLYSTLWIYENVNYTVMCSTLCVEQKNLAQHKLNTTACIYPEDFVLTLQQLENLELLTKFRMVLIFIKLLINFNYCYL